MITYEMLKNFKDEEVAMLKDARTIANEAEQAEELISKTWLFRNKQTELLIWQDAHMGITEYLTHDGKWRRDIAGNGCIIIECSAAEIFEYFIAEFLFKNDCGCVREDADETAKKAGICNSFRKFLKRTEEKYDSMTK